MSWFLTLLVWQSRRIGRLKSIRGKLRANFYRALVRFTYLKPYPLGLWNVNRMNAFEWVLNTPWMLIECMWMPLSDCEQPLNTHCVRMNPNEWVWTASEQHCMHMNVIEWMWTPIECTWTPLSYYWMQLTVVWPWERMPLCENWTAPECWMWLSVHECLWVSIEQPLNAIECMWMPLSEYWTPPECYWVHVNTFEWAWTAAEHPLSSHDCLWVSIWKVWMCTSRLVN